jgi:tetratricopeptide (TPR) repeat protein
MTKPPVLWFLAAFLAAASTAQTTGAAESFAHALQLQAAGDFAGAVLEYRHVLALDPSSFSAHANLGAALAHQGEYSSAIAEYQAALKTAPGAAVPAVRENMALALYKSGQFAEAASEFEAVHGADTSQANAVLLAADCYLRMGEFDRVINLLNPISASDPDNRAIAYMLGMALIRSGRPEEGQKLVDGLLRGGESAETHYLLGSVAFMGKDYPAAVSEFGAALKLDRTLPSLYSYYGRALLFSGDPDAAAQAFREQLAADSNDYDANFQLGEILRFRKSFSAAAPLYAKAATLRPAAVEARYGLALCDIASDRFAAARNVLEGVVAEVPDFAGAHSALAEADQGLGLASSAEAERKLAAKLAPRKDAAGLASGSQAPDFALLPANGETRVRLSSFRGKKPAVVVFGSYTCPKFRSQVDALNALHAHYRDRAGFLLVYIREAHGASSWQSTANTRAGVALPNASNLDQKRSYASMCVSKLKIHYPAVVDGMDHAVEKQWSAFPSRVYVLDKAGRVIFNSVLDQQQFDAAALEAALRQAL